MSAEPRKSYGRGEIWLVNLNPNRGNEPGKIRPALVVQTDHLNGEGHPTCLVCPISSQQHRENILRLPITINGLDKNSFILVDQVRSIDVDKRFLQLLGTISPHTQNQVDLGLRLVFNLL